MNRWGERKRIRKMGKEGGWEGGGGQRVSERKSGGEEGKREELVLLRTTVSISTFCSILASPQSVISPLTFFYPLFPPLFFPLLCKNLHCGKNCFQKVLISLLYFLLFFFAKMNGEGKIVKYIFKGKGNLKEVFKEFILKHLVKDF